jgi:nanoRNase/pAp phosphatase (c-di-AMP/oligoRNAs hydrolase)
VLIERLRKLPAKKHVLILPHDNPDPDAIASAWGLSYLLKRKMNLNSTIAYGGLIGRAENRALVRTLKIPLVQYDPAILSEDQSIILVDCQPYTGNNSLPLGVIPDGIIDHHPKRKTTKYKRWVFIDEKIGATSTMVTASFKRQRLFIPKKIATALFYAIRSETKDLGWEGTDIDYNNYLFLLPKVDFKALYRIEHPPLSKAYYLMIKEAINKSRLFKDVAVCPLGKAPYPELPAEIADFLVFRDRVKISLVTGFYENDMYLSLRSLDRTVNSADVMQQLVKDLGRGGGHEIMAGGKIPDVTADKISDLQDIITKRLLKIFSISGRYPKKFV